MTDSLWRDIKVILISVASTVVASLLIWAATAPLTRISRLEQTVQAIQVDLSSFHTDHMDLKQTVDSHHTEEMQAIQSLRGDVLNATKEAAKAAALAKLEIHNLKAF